MGTRARPKRWNFAVEETPNRGGPVYAMGIPGIAAICHAGWALGVGRRLLDELIGLVAAKAGRASAQSESNAFLDAFGDAEAQYRAARALVLETWHDVQETLRRGDRLSVRQHTLIRLAAVHVTTTAQAVGRFVYAAGGTTALRAGAIERLFRDLHAGTQHMIVSPPRRQRTGCELAGLAAGRTWRFMELVEP